MSPQDENPPYTALKLGVSDGVAEVTLTRSAALNALSMELKLDLARVITEVGDRHDIRAVIITGQGRAFCAGGDITEMDPTRTTNANRERMERLLTTVVVPLSKLQKPVIAAVNGHAHGAGLSLALSADIVLAADDAVFSLAFTRVGLVPDFGSLYFLSRHVPPKTAKELIFSAKQFGAEEAQQFGMVNHVLPKTQVLPAARELAVELAQGPTVAFGMAKLLLEQASVLPLEQMTQLESYAQAVTQGTADHREGVQAFLEKRPARFTGQ